MVEIIFMRVLLPQFIQKFIFSPGSFRFWTISVEVEAFSFIRIIATIIIIVATPSTGNTSLIFAPEVRFFANFCWLIATADRFVFAIFAVSISVTLPIGWNASTRGTFELKSLMNLIFFFSNKRKFAICYIGKISYTKQASLLIKKL